MCLKPTVCIISIQSSSRLSPHYLYSQVTRNSLFMSNFGPWVPACNKQPYSVLLEQITSLPFTEAGDGCPDTWIRVKLASTQSHFEPPPPWPLKPGIPEKKMRHVMRCDVRQERRDAARGEEEGRNQRTLSVTVAINHVNTAARPRRHEARERTTTLWE